MAANISNKSRKSRNSTSQTPGTGKPAAYRTNVASHETIHRNANINANSNPRINWFILGSWSVVLIISLAFWAGVAAMISAMF